MSYMVPDVQAEIIAVLPTFLVECFVQIISGADQSQMGKGCVTNLGISVIPVAGATHSFGQTGSRCGNDSAGSFKGQ